MAKKPIRKSEKKNKSAIDKKINNKSKVSKTSFISIILIIICTVFTSAGQILFKIATNNLVLTFTGIITNYWLILGCVSYGIGSIIMLKALKTGELSVLYPFIALSFIWVAFLSMFLLGEKIQILNWLGIISIIVGVSFIGRGSR